MTSELDDGRACYTRQAWTQAHALLSRADRRTPLGPEDLERLATSAYMLGRDDDYVEGLQRAHAGYLDAGDVRRAVRCAFWTGLNLAIRGRTGRATGWFGRAQRLLQSSVGAGAERGYLLVPVVLDQLAAGDWEGAYATAAEAVQIAEHFADRDLFAIAIHEQGHALLELGRREEGLSLLDEAMVAVTAGELSPIVTGLLYCSVIEYCRDAYALRRAQEWTGALRQWWARQPDLVAFTGLCLVHRAEILQLAGAWKDALDEAERAGRRFELGQNRFAAGEARYQQGEVHRLVGQFAAAEQAYREASRLGCEPQPGLALLRLATGDTAAAAAAIRRATDEATTLLRRARLLPAYVEIMVAAGELGPARTACAELEEIAAGRGGNMLEALVNHAKGAIDLADGDARAALVALRAAWRRWQELEAPYEAARARVLIGRACRSLGDDDGAALELDAAREVFAELGAAPDVARVGPPAGDEKTSNAHGLTARELQVLRLVAAGDTNRAIAAELVVSERTVDRHVSNIFVKLGVPSRTAATAYAYEHDLV